MLNSGVMIQYSECNDGDVRLVNGSNVLMGRLELCINNAWGTVCSGAFSAGFSANEAEVVCRQLGHLSGK